MELVVAVTVLVLQHILSMYLVIGNNVSAELNGIWSYLLFLVTFFDKHKGYDGSRAVII